MERKFGEIGLKAGVNDFGLTSGSRIELKAEVDTLLLARVEETDWGLANSSLEVVGVGGVVFQRKYKPLEDAGTGTQIGNSLDDAAVSTQIISGDDAGAGAELDDTGAHAESNLKPLGEV